MFGLSTLETYLAVAGLSLLALVGWSAHERIIGEKAIRDADAKALVIAEQKAAAETAALQAQVNAAKAEANNEEAVIENFLKSNPVGPVRVCHVAPGGAVPQGPGNSGGANGPSAGSAPVPQVPATVAGPDISGGLTLLMSTAARLAVILGEAEQVIGAHK